MVKKYNFVQVFIKLNVFLKITKCRSTWTNVFCQTYLPRAKPENSKRSYNIHLHLYGTFYQNVRKCQLRFFKAKCLRKYFESVHIQANYNQVVSFYFMFQNLMNLSVIVFFRAFSTFFFVLPQLIACNTCVCVVLCFM